MLRAGADVEARRLDNPIAIPDVLSFLTYRRWKAEVHGLVDFPKDQWPDNIALLYYTYHIMVGLGTIFVAIYALAALMMYRRRLIQTPLILWAVMLLAPFDASATRRSGCRPGCGEGRFTWYYVALHFRVWNNLPF